MKLAEFIKPLSLEQRAQLAEASQTSYLHLRNIAFSGKSCGPMLAVSLEHFSGRQVRRWDLRPDDWHRMWPELIGTEGAPPINTETAAQEAA